MVAAGGLLGVRLFLFVSLDPGQPVLEIGRGELPSEGPGGLVVTTLEGDQPVFDLVKAGEVVGCDDLALRDGEKDLNDLPGGSVGWQRQRAWMEVFSSALMTYSSSPSGTPSVAVKMI
jgi:hypothetical protein